MPLTDYTDHDLLIRIATTVESLDHRLFGNGKPGEIDVLKDRAKVLEEFKNKLLGGFILLGAFTTVTTSALVYHLLFGGKP